MKSADLPFQAMKVFIVFGVTGLALVLLGVRDHGGWIMGIDLVVFASALGLVLAFGERGLLGLGMALAIVGVDVAITAMAIDAVETGAIGTFHPHGPLGIVMV